MNTFGECEESLNHQRIVLKEKRSKIYFLNDKKSIVRKVYIDKCVIKNGPRCDYLLIGPCSTEQFVELKGSDVKYALFQVEETIKKVSNHPKRHRKKIFVISTRCPLASPEVQKNQIHFKQKYNAALVIRHTGFEVEI